MVIIEIAVVMEKEVGAVESDLVERTFRTAPAVVGTFVVLVENGFHFAAGEPSLSIVIGHAVLHGDVVRRTGVAVQAEADRVIPDELIVIDEDIAAVNDAGAGLQTGVVVLKRQASDYEVA